MRFLKSLFVCLILGIFVVTQDYAIAETTRVNTGLVQGMIQITHLPENPAATFGLLNRLEAEIDTNLDQASQIDAADESDSNDDNADEAALASPSLPSPTSARMERIRARWTKRMPKRADRAIRKVDRQIDRMDDAKLKTEAVKIEQTALVDGRTDLANEIDAGLAGTSDLRGTLKAEYGRFAGSVAAILPGEIAKAGGLFPFVLHVKKNIRELRAQLDTNVLAPNSLRCILIFILCAVAFLGVIFGGVLLGLDVVRTTTGLILTGLGYLIIPVGILLGAVAGLALDSLLEGRNGCPGI